MFGTSDIHQPIARSSVHTLGQRRIRTDGKPRLSLALQGGGAFGAFTWGVLDRLLEEGIGFDAVSGASAGAVNAVLLASGLAGGGPEEARESLHDFWTGLAHVGALAPFLSTEIVRASAKVASPYQFNPLGLNPMRDLLEREVDFEAVQTGSGPRLLISATRVSDGALRIFRTPDVTLDVVMASSCLPRLHHAVMVNGEPHWDGGYASNPPLLELVAASRVSNVLVVQLIPSNDEDLPTTVADIDRRLSQITFNGPLQAEMHALETLRKLSEVEVRSGQTSVLSRKLDRLKLHKIAAEDHVDGLTRSSVLNIDSAFLLGLRDSGRAAAEGWLESGTFGQGQPAIAG